ncbi:MAG: hypothetical protein [Mu-like cryoconite phage AB09]|nr:MAG: hypothetical protein [Mu-like cryoconite phage AB09]
MEEIVVLILTNPAIRAFVEGVAVKIVAEIFHRRAVDPEFLKRSDEVFARYSQAQSEEENASASKDIQALFNS